MDLAYKDTMMLKKEEEQEDRGQLDYIGSHYKSFGLISFGYSILYAFCLHKNYYGISFPFLVAGTVLLLAACMKKLKRIPDKMFYFFGLLTIIISIATVFTVSSFFYFFNLAAIIILMNLAAFHVFYNVKEWKGGEYLSGLFHMIGNMIVHCIVPFRHLTAFISKGEKKKNRYIISIGIGLLISIPVLSIILFLLTSADEVFRKIIHKFILDIFSPIEIFSIFVMIIFSYTCFYTYVLSATIKVKPVKIFKKIKRLDTLIAVTFTSVLAAVYVLFCGVQVVYLFAGGIGRLPSGFTFAEYARRGFFELLFVSMLNILIVLACKSRFHRHKVLNTILFIVSLCTYVLVASSAYRMILYIQSYHLTFLRVFVLWFLVVLFFILSGSVISLYREKFSFFRYSIVTTAVLYAGFCFMRPNYLIADYNVKHIKIMQAEDVEYLLSLSIDAAPVIADINIKEVEISRLVFRV